MGALVASISDGWGEVHAASSAAGRWKEIQASSARSRFSVGEAGGCL
jgi:hypothetical protein